VRALIIPKARTVRCVMIFIMIDHGPQLEEPKPTSVDVCITYSLFVFNITDFVFFKIY